MVERYAGAALMAFAAIHTSVALILFRAPLLDVLGAGVGSGPFGWSSEMLAAFWFLAFSWPLFLTGYVTYWAYARTGEIPATGLGAGLAGVAALSVVFLPVSGLWLFVGLGTMILASRRARVESGRGKKPATDEQER
ncbi:MAG: DUF6463 family protein [Rubrobacteraceae bacterium]